METAISKHDPILEGAWQQHARFDLSADRRAHGYYQLRKWVAWLGIVATLFAILTQEFYRDLNPLNPSSSSFFQGYFTLGLGIKVLFIASPLIAAVFAAVARRSYSNASLWIYRAGAEEVKEAIYLYRTILPKDQGRTYFLVKRLREIQRAVVRNLGAEYNLEKYNGPLPSRYRPDRPDSDPGFHDLTGDEYVKYRLKHQLDWHSHKIIQLRRERSNVNLAILAAGGLGAMLAAFGGFLSIWVAMTASITSVLLGWQEVRKVDTTIADYSDVVLGLHILYSHWQNLNPAERTLQEFEKMVLGCERTLWTSNRKFIRSTIETLGKADLEKDAALITEIVRQSADSVQRAKEKIHENIIEAAEEFYDKTARAVLETLATEASSEIARRELEAMGEEKRRKTGGLPPSSGSKGRDEEPPASQ